MAEHQIRFTNRAGYERMRPLVQQAITQALLPR